MSPNKNAVADEAAQAASSLNGEHTGAPAPNDLERVRKILFGQTESAIDGRLQQLEEALAAHAEEMREKLNAEADRLASLVAERSAELQQQLEREEAARFEMHASLRDAVSTVREDLETGQAAASDSFSKELAALREELEAASRELGATKTGRTELAALLDQFAKGLRDD